MIATSDLLLSILRLALTTATLTLPAISVAYFIIAQIEEESKRMSKVIGYGSLSAIILVICSIFTFGALCFGYENETFALLISGVLFTAGCFLILYVLLILAGFRREIPIPKKHKETEK